MGKADKSVSVKLHGVKELNRAFKQVEGGLSRELRIEFKAVAEAIVSRTRPKVPRVTGAAQASVRPRATSTGASIVGGAGRAEPYYRSLEFKNLGAPGRFIYPTIAESTEVIGRGADEALETVIKRAGFETHGSAD